MKLTGNRYMNDYCIVLEVQVKKTGRHTIRAQVKRDKEKLQTQVKDRVTIFYMYTNQSRSMDRAYNLKNQSY